MRRYLWLLLCLPFATHSAVIPPYIDPDHTHDRLLSAGVPTAQAAVDGLGVIDSVGNDPALTLFEDDGSTIAGQLLGFGDFERLSILVEGNDGLFDVITRDSGGVLASRFSISTSTGVDTTLDISLNTDGLLSSGSQRYIMLRNGADDQMDIVHRESIALFIDANNNATGETLTLYRNAVDEDDGTAVEVLEVNESGDLEIATQEVYAPELSYVRTNGSGTILDDQNVASVTDQAGNGEWQINFDTNTFSGTPVCTCTALGGVCEIGSTQTASSYEIDTSNFAGTGTDLGFYAICLHTQQN